MQLIVHQLKEKIKRISMKVKCCLIGQEVVITELIAIRKINLK